MMCERCIDGIIERDIFVRYPGEYQNGEWVGHKEPCPHCSDEDDLDWRGDDDQR